MKKTLALLLSIIVLSQAQAQGFKNILKKDSSGRNGAQRILGGSSKGLSADEIASGLKEALSVGANNASQKLSAVDGFFKDAAIKILMPPEAQKVEKTLRGIGLGKQVDKTIESMNRAAEDAAKSAAPIFIDAIKQMTIQDAAGILKGSDVAATDYLKSKTTSALTASFRPSIEASLQKVNATKYWNDLFTQYNKISKQPVNTDLIGYVTEKALTGIFYQVAQEEKKIRTNPAARVSDLLKKVFGS